MMLLLATLAALQGVDPAAAFAAMEKALAEAPTVTIRFKGRQEARIGEAAPVTSDFSGELQLKGPRLARYRLNNGKHELIIASDGTSLQAGLAASPRRRESPADLCERFFHPSVAKAGLVAILALPTGYAGKDVEDRRTGFTAADFKALEPEDGLTRIRYTLKAAPSGRSYEMTLALDPASGLPRRRTLVGQDARSTSVVTETYEPWVLGGEIADEAFALPAAK